MKGSKCLDIFNNIYEYLNKKESEEYPYHYDVLKRKKSYIEKLWIRVTFKG